MRDISSRELVASMGIGWNLGNTLDAIGDGLDAETIWQPDLTSREMMKLLRNTGFDMVRIPVTWGSHMDESFAVDPKWFSRVREVVDFALDEGHKVILNTHHEDWYYPRKKDLDRQLSQLRALWGQIAEGFKDYDERLLFEGVNEPRCRGEAIEWTEGDEESREVVALYAKTFYDTVRSSGGNNSKRHLLLTGYAASSRYDAMKALWLPENDDKVIASLHAYLPYRLALDLSVRAKTVWDEEGRAEIDRFMRELDEALLSRGVTVILGEYGLVNRHNLPERIAAAEYYISSVAKLGVPVLWWDNNSFEGDGECLGLMDRKKPGWVFPELVETIIKASRK